MRSDTFAIATHNLRDQCCVGLDSENWMVSVTGTNLTASFTYNGDGQRVKSVINGERPSPSEEDDEE